jgi:hypothetical protein
VTARAGMSKNFRGGRSAAARRHGPAPSLFASAAMTKRSPDLRNFGEVGTERITVTLAAAARIEARCKTLGISPAVALLRGVAALEREADTEARRIFRVAAVAKLAIPAAPSSAKTELKRMDGEGGDAAGAAAAPALAVGEAGVGVATGGLA